MFVIYGTRFVGAVDGYGGQHAATEFAHVFWILMAHIEGRWVQDAGNGGGHAMRPHGRSIAAGYLRTWGPAWAFVAFLVGGWIGTPIGIAATALTLWTWSWRFQLGGRARRASDLNQLAFGTRCEARYFTAAQRAAMRDKLEGEWAALSEGRTPAEVAERGATSVAQAVVAYGLLRLLACEARGAEARRADADAAKLLGRIGDVPTTIPSDPYRQQRFTAVLQPTPAAPAKPAPPRAPKPAVWADALEARAAPTVAPEDVSALARALEQDLAPFGFTRHAIAREVMGTTIEAAWTRKRYSNVAVVVVHAPPTENFGQLACELKSSLEVRLPRAFPTVLRALELHLVFCGDALAPSAIAELDRGLTFGWDSCEIKSVWVVDLAQAWWTNARWKRPGPAAEIIGGYLQAALERRPS